MPETAAPTGTVELLARELASALGILQRRLGSPSAAAGLFGELGLRPPTALLAAGDVVAALTAAAGDIGELGPLIAALTSAIEADDTAAILEAGGRLLLKIGEVIAGAIDVGTALADAAGNAGNSEVTQFAAELPGRLAEYVVVEHTAERAPRLLAALELLGLAERRPDPGIDGDPLHPPALRRALHLDRLPLLLTDPGEHLRAAWGWGDPNFDGVALLGTLQRALERDVGTAAVLLQPPGEPAILEAYVAALRVDDTTTPPSLVLDLRLPAHGSISHTAPLRDPWQAETQTTADFSPDVQARLTPPLQVELTHAADTVDLSFSVGMVADAASNGGGPLQLLGATGGSRLEAARVALRLGIVATWDPTTGHAAAVPQVEAEVRDGRAVVGFGGADGFLASVLPGEMQTELDLSARWNPVDGLEVDGAVGMALTLPLALDLGPARLDRLDLLLGIGGAGLALETRLAGGIALGPFGATVEGIGAAADLALTPGNLGPVDLSLRFLPPTGLGLSIGAGPVQGGGFVRFDEPAGRYAGALEVAVGPVGVTAVALLDTRLPGGEEGFALLVLLRARFPPIQLGLGFALSSVGGLLALNRRVDVDALRDRMAAGTAGRILAPEDPVGNATVLLDDLGAVFPATPGVTVVGPTLQISWVELVRLDVGVFVELPGPTKVVLLGSARVTVDNPSGGRSYLQLRMDIVGLLDLAKQVLEFDAVLIDSHILEILEITGGVAFRLSWGAEPYVVLSVGGFHPAYSPAPLVFPSSLTRVGMSRGHPDDLLYLRLEGYLAVTTNTLQVGASIEAIVNVGPFSARGFLGFDALVRFQPFWFEFGYHSSVSLRFDGHTLCGVSLTGTVSGPGPVVFRGRACIEILWFEICMSATVTLGSRTPPAVTPVESAVAALAETIADPTTLRTIDAVDPWVAVEPVPDELPLPVVSPRGQLVWSQDRAPLDLLLQRFEGAPLSTWETVTATGPQVIGHDSDWFAPGSFAELNAGGALNRRAFERLHAGVVLAHPGTADGPAVLHDVSVRQIRLPDPSQVVDAEPLPGWVEAAVAGRTGDAERAAVMPALAVHDEVWDVHGTGGDVVAGGTSQAQAHQMATVGGAGVAVAQPDPVPGFTF